MVLPDPDLLVRAARWDADRAAIESVRRAVFIEEQRIAESDEWDSADPVCRHVLAETPNRDAIGTGRLEHAGKIGRVAVLAAYRGSGIGKALMLELIELAKADGLGAVHLSAQESAIGFYRQLGFVSDGAPFDEVGIPHQRMVLAIR